jgi:hypothetical protein
MKATAFLEGEPCSPVEVYRRFRGVHFFHNQDVIALVLQAINTSETSVNFYRTTRCNFSEDRNFLATVHINCVILSTLF